LGQFKLPVTITPASNTIFFIDPRSGVGDDNNPGTAARPWQSVENVLDGNKPTGLRVAAVASAGNDVVVTILAGGTENAAAINTPNLPAGSVTVLKAPSAERFTLNMGGNQLTLNKGYKLQDIKIKSNRGGGSSSETAVEINHPTAGLASVEVECTGNNVICVKVTGSGLHTLRDVTVDVKDNNSSNTGILINANASLSIVGGIVKLTAITGTQQPITLIQADGVLTATGLTVDMRGGSTAHTQGSKGIVLNAPGSSVTGSTIKVNNGPGGAGGNAIGIHVLSGASKSTVEGNTFKGGGSNSVGVRGNDYLSSNALEKNTFEGTFADRVQPN
jgi:hypothetical protein